MAQIPFAVPLSATLAANGSIDLSYQIPNTWKLHVNKWFQHSTGAFSIYDIRDSTGKRYTNASVTVPILNTFIQDPTTQNRGFKDWSLEFYIDGNLTFSISVKDTTGSTNTINMLLVGSVDIPS